MSQMLKSSGAMGAATMTSRLLGLVREVAYTGFMGTTWVADAFNLAFMVPNLFRRLLGEGALTAAFIPIFKEKEKLSGEKEMWHAANAVISGLTAASCGVIVLGLAAITAVTWLQTWGQALQLAAWLQRAFPYVLAASAVAGQWVFIQSWTPSPSRLAWLAGAVVGGAALVFLALLLALAGPVLQQVDAGKTWLMLHLLRVMFPYLLFVCLAAILMGMLNARGHFFVPAMGATMLNVVMIASVWWLAPRMGQRLEERILGLAIGVVVAGIAQAAFQWPLLHKEGFRFAWVNPVGEPTVERVVTQMIPGAMGVAAFRINVLVTQSMAFWVGSGVVSSFTVAVRLMELPQGVFGISLATYLLPTLSGLAAEKKYPEFRSTLAQGLSWLVFINLLAAALLFSLAEPIIRLLFERGLFSEESTHNSALALKCLAPGLVAFSVVNVLARAFYALGDTQTPMRISVFCLLLNLLLASVLVFHFKQAGLGVANTMSAVTNMSLLFYALRRKLKTLELASVRQGLGVLGAAALLAAALAWLLAREWAARLGHGNFLLRAGEVFIPMAVAALVYLGIAAVTRAGHMKELLAMARRRKG
jgi:putative peptidoglycan lipid II flippase